MKKKPVSFFETGFEGSENVPTRYKKIKHATVEDWLETRRQSITATDVARIVGLSRFGDSLSVYMSKKKPKEQNESDVGPMYFGKILERPVLEAFKKVTGLDAKPNGMTIFKHRRFDFMACTPDGIISNNRKPVGLEIKTTRIMSGWPSVRSGEILDCGDCSEVDLPADVECQVQWSLGVTGFSAWYIAALIQGNDFRIYRVTPNKTEIHFLQSVAAEFWKNHIVNDAVPEVTANSEKSDLDRLYPKAIGEDFLKLNGDETDVGLWCEAYEKASEEARLASSAKEFAAMRLKAAIKDARGAEITRGDKTFVASWSNRKGSVRIDSARLKKEKPDIFKDFSTRSEEFRAFTLKQKRK
tara:strand:+ start:1274 stop:2341 length:1068 start_codon:yes stop_codon:yes gene_type:complete